MGVCSVLLEATSITKSFAGVHALRGVSFDLRPGEVHALVGENGAGKSTLIKIITGAETADSGAVTVAGRVVPRMDPPTARSLGIAAIYQHPAMFPDLDVTENIALSLDGGRAVRRVDWHARRQMALDLLQQVGAAIDPDRLAETLSMPERQLVEIAKAIGASGRILIMDEPTASLTAREIDNLLGVVRGLRAHGAGVIYISHKLEEVFAVADRVTVLRDGESVATRQRDQLDAGELVRLMVGRELAAVYRGEILGVAGLVGSGRTELAETIFGLTPRDAGDILVNGTVATIGCPADAIRLGIGYVPEDRQRHGVIAEMSIAANTTLNNLAAVSRRGVIDAGAERHAAARYVEQLRIKTPSVRTAVGELSGGNQQKVALARWLAIEPAVLMLDEPTQGIDIGAKAEIHEIMERLAEKGIAIVMMSSDLPELLAMADRIAVMRRGALAGILGRDEATAQTVMTLALGHAA